MKKKVIKLTEADLERIVKLTESDIERIVKRVLNEQNINDTTDWSQLKDGDMVEVVELGDHFQGWKTSHHLMDDWDLREGSVLKVTKNWGMIKAHRIWGNGLPECLLTNCWSAEVPTVAFTSKNMVAQLLTPELIKIKKVQNL